MIFMLANTLAGVATGILLNIDDYRKVGVWMHVGNMGGGISLVILTRTFDENGAIISMGEHNKRSEILRIIPERSTPPPHIGH